MIFKDIVAKKTYTGKDGQEKAVWNNVGTLKTTDEGKMFIELSMFPNIPFYVFDRKPREEKTVQTEPSFNPEAGEVNPDDIAF